MTAIGSIGGSSTTSWEILLRKSSATSAGTAASSGVGGAANPQGVSALKEQLEEAIESALAGIDRSAAAKPILDAVKSAVDATLKSNGIEPPQGKGGRPTAGPPPSGAGGPGGPGAPGGTAGGAQSAGSSEESDDSEDPLRALIDRVLAEAGFDVSRIQQEMKASAENASLNGGATSARSNTTGGASIWVALFAQLQQGGVDAQA